MRVLGIDPGLQCMGWGVIEQRGSRLIHVADGVCTTKGSDLSADGLARDVQFFGRRGERAQSGRRFERNKRGQGRELAFQLFHAGHVTGNRGRVQGRSPRP